MRLGVKSMKEKVCTDFYLYAIYMYDFPQFPIGQDTCIPTIHKWANIFRCSYWLKQQQTGLKFKHVQMES